MNIQLITTSFDAVFNQVKPAMNEESVNLFLGNFAENQPYSDWIIEEYLDAMDSAKPTNYLMKKHSISFDTAYRVVLAGRQLMGAEACH